MTIAELRSMAENTGDASLIAALRHIDSYIMQLERMYKERDALNIVMSTKTQPR